MANASVPKEVAEWLRQNWIPLKFGQSFTSGPCRFSSGGTTKFSAVSLDRKIVAAISTGGATTAAGKPGVGKRAAILAQILFLVMAETERRLVILTEKSMLDWCNQESRGGRMPLNVEFHLADLPDELRLRLDVSKKTASREVSPSSR